jgi:hypothetical protein
MEARKFKPYIIVLSLMVLTSLVLAYTVDVNMTNEAGVNVYLPDEFADWTGREVRYCQNPEHQAVFFAEEVEDANTCPDCGAELHMMSVDERRVLPADTIILKKQYSHPTGQDVTASIVLSGADRSSIHRPQLCLTGQGRDIVREWTHTVDLPGRDPLKVMVLDMVFNMQGQQINFYYAYWFVGKGRETPSHYERMFWMGFDRIIHNVSHRWAYISVSGVRNDDYVNQIDEFIETIYPQMALSQ